jgi:hypothetical protein
MLEVITITLRIASCNIFLHSSIWWIDNLAQWTSLMSIEQVTAFGKLAMSDEKLRAELLSAVEGMNSEDAARAAAAVATRHGYHCTPEQVKEGYLAYIDANKAGSGGELSDAQLAAVAGGGAGKTANAAWSMDKSAAAWSASTAASAGSKIPSGK